MTKGQFRVKFFEEKRSIYEPGNDFLFSLWLNIRLSEISATVEKGRQRSLLGNHWPSGRKGPCSAQKITLSIVSLRNNLQNPKGHQFLHVELSCEWV